MALKKFTLRSRLCDCGALESIKRTCVRSYKSSSKTIIRIQSKGVSRQNQRRKHKIQTGNKTGRRISTIKPTQTHNTPSTLESGRKEKDAGAHPYKITKQLNKNNNNEIKIIIIRCEHLRFTYHYLLGWFSIVFGVIRAFWCGFDRRLGDRVRCRYRIVVIVIRIVFLYQQFGSRLLIRCHCMHSQPTTHSHCRCRTHRVPMKSQNTHLNATISGKRFSLCRILF